MNKIQIIYILSSIAILTSCSAPKEIIQKIESGKKEIIDFPIEYSNLFPNLNFEQWDKDYNTFDRYLTKDIMKTQIGLTSNSNGVQTWICVPSAKTHVQLDTITMIIDKKSVVGNWRSVCNRRVSFKDSAVIAEKKIYRSSKLIDQDQNADLFLSITDAKFNLYGAEKTGNKFKLIANKNYEIQSKRFLLLFGTSKLSAAVSFIGIDKDNHLIINSYWVQERKVKGTYITYEAVMMQNIYKSQI